MEQTLARPLTRAQQARRQRVIDAAMALGLEGGYEAVQMRDVAARADVAMGTVYRYFTSKEHLLAATLVYWREMLDTRTPRRDAMMRSLCGCKAPSPGQWASRGVRSPTCRSVPA